MSEHSDLIAEISQVEKMSTPERLKHAKKRRSQQLKRFANYEKQLEKDKSKKNKQSQNNQKRQNRKRARVRFIHNIMLLESAARNDIEEVRKLLMAGVSPDVTNEDGLTALHQCCIDDSEDMLRLLLEFGANVNARDSEMWTPLHAAATCGHVHLCKLLIDKGAELLAVNADGNMPYDICEDEVALDYIETEMAKRGITQEEIDEKRLETEQKMLADLKKLADEGRHLEFRDKNRATPLHIAAANGYVEVVQFLLDHHVSMEVRDEDSWLPIHAAACWLQPEVIEMLVKNGADLDAKTRNGETPFDLAEDPDVKQKILDLKDELETHRARSHKDHPRNRRVNTRGASIRRTSMRGEKRPLFKKEAKEEAMHFGMFSMNNDEDVDLMDDNKENLPATNIDDVKIIIDEEPDRYVIDPPEKQTNSNKSGSVKTNKTVSPSNKHSDIPRETQAKKKAPAEPAVQAPRGRSADESDSKKSEPPRNGYEPEPIHIHMARTDSSPKPKPARPESGHVKEAQPHSEKDTNNRPQSSPSSPPRAKPPGQPGTGRTPSFRKNRDSQRRNREDTSPPDPSRNSYGVTGQVRYPSGTPTGTLADLKKHRAEQHKFGNSLDAQVQNLFLHSLSGDGKKYSSGGSASTSPQPQQPPPQPTRKESTQNGRNVKNNNNNNNNGNSRPAQPPTFITDSGPLRRFSAPTSAPVIGEDDKFKSNCCVVM